MKKEKIDYINKAFKTEIYIPKLLIPIIKQWMGNRRFIFNQTLSIIEKINDRNNPIKYYYETDENNNAKEVSILNKKNFQYIGTYLNEEYSFLSKSHSQSNQSAIHSLHKAYSNYLDSSLTNFEKPKYKKKKGINTFYLPNQNNIELNLNNKTIYIKPFDRFIKEKLENIFKYDKVKYKSKKDYNTFINQKLTSINLLNLKNKVHKDFIKYNCLITGITLKEDNKRYFISISYKYLKPNTHILTSQHLIEYINNKSNKLLGIDLGIKDKLIKSTGEKIKGIHSSVNFKTMVENQKTLQRKLSNVVKVNKKKLLSKKYSEGYNSISSKDCKKLTRSRKRDKYLTKKFDLFKLIEEGKITLLKKDYKFTKKEWKKIYSHKNIRKYKKEIKKIELKLKHIKDNENHHISKKIVNDFDFIFMEDLTLKGMQKLFGNKIKVLSLGQLTHFIKYKADNQGKCFIKINKWFPSSKTCSSCGNIKKDLKLSDRIYHCSECNTMIDRDISASLNVLTEGIKTFIELEKTEYNPVSNSIRDLKAHLVEKHSSVSRVVEIN